MLNVKQINSLLVKHFGVPERNPVPPHPMNMLIGTILSQNTNDRNSYRAYLALKEKYPTWDDALNAPLPELKAVIAPAGLANQKAAAIISVLQGIKKEDPSFSLQKFYSFSDTVIIEKLTQFKGVGVKTASCVLLFALGRNVCPVDTHVHRVLNRIGLVKTTAPDKTFALLNGKIPEGAAHQFHTNLIKLGREFCRPTKPACSTCPINKICMYENKHIGESARDADSFLLLDKI